MRATIFVSGKIQGVGFRNFVRITAKYTSIKGVVRNLKDGRVEIFAEGTEEGISKMVSIFKENIGITVPARIDDIEVHEEGSAGYRGAWKDFRDKFLIDERWGD
ncbi:MAG: acylphosphatase [Candidatus Micrarchaeota archaeon]|nr:acylphosphatase [Candidatus Micrarchaeota archaeon]MDE1804904.1 acylphosphatase [Candidatus Micrarchaeota archaeon]MDE1846582.1 acylphosphatase [Candidatus Micrarchaeota archaeon]